MLQVGFEIGKKAYRCFDMSQNKIVISRDVGFDVRNVLYRAVEIAVREGSTEDKSDNAEKHQMAEAPPDENQEKGQTPVGGENKTNDVPAEEPLPRKSERLKKKEKGQYTSLISVGDSITREGVVPENDFKNEPRTHQEALQSEEKGKWMDAMNSEIESLKKRGTWSLVDLPVGKNLVTNKWVYRIKKDELGRPERYKARLVARGFSQRYGIDFEETFAPTSKLEVFRILMEISIAKNLLVHHIDVTSAYLYGKLDEEVYMEQPLKFSDHTGRVCRLN